MSAAPLSEQMLRQAVEMVKLHGSINEAAAAMQIPRATLQHRILRARALWPDALPPTTFNQGWAAPAPNEEKPRVRVKAGSSRPLAAVPLSEDQRKFHENWTAADCVEELRRIAEIDTTKVISRNYFRVHSDISESTWNRFFGTFEEFKRQAEVILSRHAHRLEKSIAKHASVDKMRALNVDKRSWEGAYEMPSSRRWQTALVINDIHDIHCCPFYRRVMMDTARRVQPEKIIINGDLFDLPEFSRHSQDPRSFNLKGRIQWVHGFLAELREMVPDSEITLVEGNHENRLLRHLSEETTAMMVILADLHGYSVSKLLGLEAYEVNLIARADLSTFTERDIKAQLRRNYMRVWDSLLFGHFPDMRNMGVPGASGHHHKHLVWTDYSPVYGPWEWHQVGCGHQREASYCAGEKWANGFLLAHTDVKHKRTQFEYVDTSHSAVVVGGKFYGRLDSEPVLDLIVV